MLDMMLDKKLVIFDVDGTLVQANHNEIPFFFSVLQEKIEKAITSDISRYQYRTFASVIQETLCDKDQKYKSDVFEFMHLRMSEFAGCETWNPLPGMIELINDLNNNGIGYCYVSGNFYNATRIKLLKSGFVPSDDNLYSVSLNDASKSNVIERIIARERLKYDDVISIGDSCYDHHVATSLGLDFINI